jgi:DNA-directed RNA polymerase subunit RPC12/RpoP
MKTLPDEPTREMWAAMSAAFIAVHREHNREMTLNADTVTEAVYRAAYGAAPGFENVERMLERGEDIKATEYQCRGCDRVFPASVAVVSVMGGEEVIDCPDCLLTLIPKASPIEASPENDHG